MQKLLGGEQAPEETDTLLVEGDMVAAQATEPRGQVPLHWGRGTGK